MLVELRQGVGPVLLAVFDLVEFLFETRCVLRIEDVLEVFDQQIGNHQADFRGNELASAAFCTYWRSWMVLMMAA